MFFSEIKIEVVNVQECASDSYSGGRLGNESKCIFLSHHTDNRSGSRKCCGTSRGRVIIRSLCRLFFVFFIVKTVKYCRWYKSKFKTIKPTVDGIRKGLKYIQYSQRQHTGRGNRGICPGPRGSMLHTRARSFIIC